MAKTARTPPRRRRASLDQKQLRKALDLLYSPDGKPSPALQKSIAHFKDRFKEVVKNVEAGEGSKAGRPSSSTTTTPDGCILTILCQMESGASDAEDARRYLSAVEARLMTPTMSKAGFGLLHDQAPTLSVLSSRTAGCVGAEVSFKGGKIEVKASMVFHHPADKYVLAEEDTAFPQAELTLRDGTSVKFDAAGGLMRMRSSKFILGFGRPAFLVSERQTTEGASKMHLLYEAVQSSRATYDSIKAFAQRTFSSSFETQDAWGSKDPRVESLTKDLMAGASLILEKCLNLEGAQTGMDSDDFVTTGRIVLGGSPMYVLVRVTPRLTHQTNLFSIQIEAEFSETFYRHLGRIRDSWSIGTKGGPYDLTAPGTVDEVLRGIKPQLKGECAAFLEQSLDRKTRFDARPF